MKIQVEDPAFYVQVGTQYKYFAAPNSDAAKQKAQTYFPEEKIGKVLTQTAYLSGAR